ncbi:MAG TPA: F0F1 ATP synthase subunit B [Candidatus Baltobacteraceae bacterium]|nr:F0F1 ATP synthase subunit B [Candidatus Baltobacteraceae bacterium]
MNYDAIAFWSQIAGFVLFVALFIWVVSKWITPAVSRAQRASNERIAQAERHRDDMRAAVESLRHEMEGAKRDAAMILERAKERARREHDEIIAEAREEGELAVRNANGELARARMAAREQLHHDLAAKALEIARATVSRRVDARGNALLLQEFVESLHGQ